MKSTIEDLVPIETVPLYQSHKKVRALKIDRVLDLTGSHVTIRIENFPESDEHVQLEVIAPGRPTPQAGWYYVVYEDGYESFSPPEAFESGYTRIL